LPGLYVDLDLQADVHDEKCSRDHDGYGETRFPGEIREEHEDLAEKGVHCDLFSAQPEADPPPLPPLLLLPPPTAAVRRAPICGRFRRRLPPERAAGVGGGDHSRWGRLARGTARIWKWALPPRRVIPACNPAACRAGCPAACFPFAPGPASVLREMVI